VQRKKIQFVIGNPPESAPLKEREAVYRRLDAQ
jgi:hypothetical protein